MKMMHKEFLHGKYCIDENNASLTEIETGLMQGILSK